MSESLASAIEKRIAEVRVEQAASALLDACESAKHWINELIARQLELPGSDLILSELEAAIRKARGL